VVPEFLEGAEGGNFLGCGSKRENFGEKRVKCLNLGEGETKEVIRDVHSGFSGLVWGEVPHWERGMK